MVFTVDELNFHIALSYVTLDKVVSDINIFCVRVLNIILSNPNNTIIITEKGSYLLEGQL